MSLPSINITFKEKGITAIQRGERGIVALILKDAASPGPFEVLSPADIPEALSEENKEQIELAMLGYRTSPRKVIGYVVGSEEDFADAQNYLEATPFNYVAVPSITEDEVDTFATWVKDLRDNKEKRVQAVLPNCPADHEGVINFTTDIIETADGIYNTAAYAGRIAGLLAGTPLTIASTFAPLPEVVDVERLTRDELDTAISNGEFVLFNDGEKVKVGRGVNSLTTTGEDKQDSFKKIKIVEAMDLIHQDIKRTAEDSYLGKYANSYDNKNLLIVAIQGYLEGLELDGILESGKSYVGIDLTRQEQYLKAQSVEVENLNEQEIKSANTQDKVFLESTITILDAIEEITLDIMI